MSSHNAHFVLSSPLQSKEVKKVDQPIVRYTRGSSFFFVKVQFYIYNLLILIIQSIHGGGNSHKKEPVWKSCMGMKTLVPYFCTCLQRNFIGSKTHVFILFLRKKEVRLSVLFHAGIK